MNSKRYFLAIALFIAPAVLAAKPDFTQQIQIDADNLSSIKENILTYRNNVVISQGTMQMKADQLEIDASAGKGKEVYVASGKPVLYSQVMADGKPVTAKANEMRYEPVSRTLTLTGDAELTQSGSVVKASVIRYNLEKQELSADSNNNKRVTTIFTPEEKPNP